VRGYEPRSRELESLPARHRINGLDNYTNCLLSEINGSTLKLSSARIPIGERHTGSRAYQGCYLLLA